MSLSKMTVTELRKQAKLKGIIGYSKLRKAQLVSKLQDGKNRKVIVRRPKIHINHNHHHGGNLPVTLPGSTPGPRCLPPLPASSIEREFGKNIFETFVKKYKVQNLFESRRKEIKIEMQGNKLTYSDYKYLNDNLIGMYEEMFDAFVNLVNTKNEFVEKSGSGNKPRKIDTAKDWAEAIIELQGLINNYQNDFQNNFKIRVFSTPEKLCNRMTLDKCLTSAECTIRKNAFSKKCVPK